MAAVTETKAKLHLGYTARLVVFLTGLGLVVPARIAMAAWKRETAVAPHPISN